MPEQIALQLTFYSWERSGISRIYVARMRNTADRRMNSRWKTSAIQSIKLRANEDTVHKCIKRD